MRSIDLVTTALRNLRRQKLRSALTIFAVVIGATSVTIMLALVTGVKGFFVNQFSANGTLQQIAISSQTDLSKFDDGNNGGNNCDSCVKLTDELWGKIGKIPHITGAARRLSGGSFEAITYNGQKLRLNQVEGYDANGVVTNTMLAGRDIRDTDLQGVVTVTSDYADKWGFKGRYGDLVGKSVNLTSRTWYQGVGYTPEPPQMGSNGGGDNRPEQKATILEAEIVGVVDGGDRGETVRAPLPWVIGMNSQQMYQETEADRKAREDAQRACQNRPGVSCQGVPPHFTLVVTNFVTQNGYSAFTAKVDDPANAAAATAEIKKLGVGAADAQSLIKAQLQIFNIISYVLGGIGGIALAVAAIGVINTMVMAILERTREIGVMRACGATRVTIRRLFTIEAGMLGFWGGVFGVAVGYGLTFVANILINRQLSSGGVQAHNIIGLPLWLIVAVIGTTTLIGMLSGLYPAFRAARLNPVEALRYE